MIRPPEVDPNRTALALAEAAAEEARATATHVDPLVTVIGDLTAGRTQRWLDELAADRAAARPPPGRAGRRRRPHHAGPAAADRRAGRARPAPRPDRRRHRQPARRVDVGGAGAALPRPRRAPRGRLTRASPATPTCCPASCPNRPATASTPSLRRPTSGGPSWAPGSPRTRRSGPARPSAPSPTPTPTPTGGPAGSSGPAGRSPTASWSATTTPPTPSAPPRPPGWPRRWPCSTPPTRRSTSPTSAPTRNGCPKAGSAPAGPPGSANSTPPRATSPTTWKPPTSAHRRASTDATIWQARADAETDPLVRDEITTAARQARETAEQLAAQIEQLTYADDARAAFLVDSAVTRDKAERARVAAGLRGINLDDHSDRVTAQEWLDAHLADQRADEADREITEDDLSRRRRAHRRASPTSDPTSPTTTTPRVREPDPAERADPAARRRVPPPDATTAAFDRAQQVLREVAERQQAEQAAAAHAAELESEDEQLRAELARQAAYDTDADARRRGHRRRRAGVRPCRVTCRQR